MPRVRLVLSIVFAFGTLSVSSLYAMSFYHLIPPGLDKGSSIIAIILSVIAFVLCLRIKSYVDGVVLIMAGIVMQIPPVQAIIGDGRILIPGPILGVIFFCPILILGLVKLATSRAAPSAKTLVQHDEMIGPRSS
jgi:hypothetical protein